jgi:hypothetical protein
MVDYEKSPTKGRRGGAGIPEKSQEQNLIVVLE